MSKRRLSREWSIDEAATETKDSDEALPESPTEHRRSPGGESVKGGAEHRAGEEPYDEEEPRQRERPLAEDPPLRLQSSEEA